MGAAMYAQQQSEGGAQQPGPEGAAGEQAQADDEVVDAEIVDDDQKREGGAA